MSQWLHEEELLADYVELRSSNTSERSLYLIAALSIMGALALLARGPSSFLSLLDMAGQSKLGEHWSSSTKHHMV